MAPNSTPVVSLSLTPDELALLKNLVNLASFKGTVLERALELKRKLNEAKSE